MSLQPPPAPTHVRQRQVPAEGPSFKTFDISGRNAANLLSHPIVTPLMPVTTYYHPRSLPHPNAIDEFESAWPEDSLLRFIREGDDRDDPMGGSPAGLYSSDEGEEPNSVWHASASETDKWSNPEESDHLEFSDNPEVTVPSAKRRKLEKAVPSGGDSSSKSPAKTKRSRVSRKIQGRLQNMLSLPFDVLFLILAELGPMDLVNLARTNKALRQVLMSRKSIWVWLVVRRNAGATTVPDPPNDMSEPAWALLLFGPAVCSQCSTRNIHRVDFALRRRLCTVCRKKNLVPAVKFRSQFAGLRESVMDLLPHTKIGGWVYRRLSNSRFYWKPDIIEMDKRLSELEAENDMGKPGAQKRLESFCEERKHLVDSIVQSCPELEIWAKAEAEAQASDVRERRIQRRKALKDRILAAGYDSADIDYIGISAVPGANVSKVLTEEAWKRIRTKVENKLNDARETRLLAERSRREKEYGTKAEQCYSDILRQVLPVQRVYLPSMYQARELSCFRELLKLDRDVEPAEWEHAAGQLRESLSEWMTLHRDRHTSLLSLCFYCSPSKSMEVRLLTDPSTVVWRHVGNHDFAGRLELATSVFRHPNTRKILIGRDVCHAWKMPGELEFLERGAAATHALLRVLQLDSETTTPSTLEQLDRRFICASCPAIDEWKQRTWRSCVSHFVESSEKTHPQPEWRVVSLDEVLWDETYGVFDLFEDVALLSTQTETETWLCNHCSDYLAPSSPLPFGRISRVGSKWDAIRHVQMEHNVEDPLVDVDVFSFPMFVNF